MTLAEIITSVTTSLNGFVPDLAVFIAAGVVLSLIAMAAKRLLKSGR